MTLKSVSEGCIFYDIDSNRLPPARCIKIEKISLFFDFLFFSSLFVTCSFILCSIVLIYYATCIAITTNLPRKSFKVTLDDEEVRW